MKCLLKEKRTGGNTSVSFFTMLPPENWLTSHERREGSEVVEREREEAGLQVYFPPFSFLYPTEVTFPKPSVNIEIQGTSEGGGK